MKTPFNTGRRAFPLPFVVGPLVAAFALAAHAQPHDAIEEVVVTGVLRDSSPGELAQSVTVVRGDTLDRIRAANLGETLANQVGVSSSNFGAGASRPIIRGLAGVRVQMLEDGIHAMDAATVSDDHAVTVDPLAADQIEIFRGPTTLLYGSGAVGGVINTVTTRIPMRAPDNGFAGAFELRGDASPIAVRARCASMAAARDSLGTSMARAATATTTRFRGLPASRPRRGTCPACSRTARPRAMPRRSAVRGSVTRAFSVSA